MLIDAEILSAVSAQYKAGIPVATIVTELTEKGYSQGEVLNILELTESTPRPFEPDYPAICRRKLHPNFVEIPVEGSQIYFYEGFLAPEFCIHLENDLCPSVTGVFSDAGVGSKSLEELNPTVFSEIAEIDKNLDLLLQTFAKLPPACSEFMRMDAFSEFDKETQTYVLRAESGDLAATERMNPRTWSFFVFLNDGLKGGELDFPELNLTFAPSRGFALLWNRVDTQGRLNQRLTFKELPVISGLRYVLRKDYRTFPIS